MKANQVDKERIGTVQKYLRLQQKLCRWHIHHHSWHSHGQNFAPSSRQRPPAGVLTIEVEVEGKLPFLGMMIIRKENTIHTEIYRKLTDTGLLQHYQSHMDKQYKRNLDWKRSSGWLESWEGLLLVTDLSTTYAEAIFRVKRVNTREAH